MKYTIRPSIITVLIVFSAAMLGGSFCQTVLSQLITNKTTFNPNMTDEGTATPTNVFVTDDGHLIKYLPEYGQVFNASKFREALSLPESRPSELDPDGHWGKSLGGLQLSLRLKQTNYDLGQPIIASLYIRNVGGQIENYEYRAGWKWPLYQLAFSITNNGFRLQRRADQEEIMSARGARIFPHSQQKYEIDLTKFYDLTNAGTYDLQATFEKAKTAVVTINITNATVNSP